MGQSQSSSAQRIDEGDVTSSPVRLSRRAMNPFRTRRQDRAPLQDDDESRPSAWRRNSSFLLGRRQSTVSQSSEELRSNEDVSSQGPSTNRTIRMLRRAQTSMSGRIPNLRRSETTEPQRDSSSSLLLESPTIMDLGPSTADAASPSSDVARPPLPLSMANEDEDLDIPDADLAPLTRHRSNGRPSSLISDRLPSLRPDRLTRTISNTLRRRRSNSSRNNDQIPALSEILTAAAAVTAATLMSDDAEAVRNARGIGGDEGTLETFLESLQNGRMASALSRSTVNANGDASNAPSINLVRLFRFGNATEARGRNSRVSMSQNSDDTSSTSEGRMIPIIIVGIRSVNSNSNVAGEQNIPSFLDSLTGARESASSTELENSTSRLPNIGSRSSQRRRASLQSYDNQRHQRSLRSRSPRPFLRSTSPRPFSSSPSEASVTPYPPPSTPASAGLSAFSSGATTPNVPSQLGTGSAGPSRRPSVNRNSTGGEPGVDETAQIPRRATRRRRLSDSDFTRWGSGSPRRNGVVEPDDAAETTSARSWIIYVLGGSYPENHPLLNTPSLFTDQPTYEDMLLLSSLIGPAKPPVASEDDVASAPGIYTVRCGEYPGSLIGVSLDTDELIAIGTEERCLVCLAEYAAEEEARKLVKCGHFFHKDCIDQWLTTGRNSCPLCRQEGVIKSPSEESTSPATSVPVTP